MSYLLQISIGPVQSFIAASRKTRDLKSGSDLLLGLVREAVQVLLDEGATMIFPAVQGKDASNAAAANVILAEVGGDPSSIAEKCREAIKGGLLGEWDKLDFRGVADKVDSALAKKQVLSFPEVFAAWYPLNGDYKAARKAVMSAMAARKSLRDFSQPTATTKPLVKSPLDPAYETVLPLDTGWSVDDNVADRLRLKERESLDGVSLIKRFRSGDKFPSTRKVAVNDMLVDVGAAEITAFVTDKDFDEGDVLFVDEGDVLFVKDAEQDRDIPREHRDEAKKLRKAFLTKAEKAYGRKPSIRPYFAVLHADGDAVGKYLDSLDSAEQHQKFSRALSERFAAKAERVVNGCAGVLVYAGGDDVVALLPWSKAIACAAKLKDLFNEAMSSAPGTVKPSLTVGIAICHVSENLQSCVEFSRSMERVGKRKRKEAASSSGALAVGVRTRGGSETVAAFLWDQEPAELFNRCVEAYQDKKLPRGFPYEVQRLATEMNGQGSAGVDFAFADVKSEYERIRRRKMPQPPEDLLPDSVASVDELWEFSNALAISHFLTRKGSEVDND
jgi:CRISPR-associated protein Cmr2